MEERRSGQFLWYMKYMPFIRKGITFLGPPFPLWASTCISLARTVSHGCTGSLMRWALNVSSPQMAGRKRFGMPDDLPRPLLKRQMRKNTEGSEISLRDWNSQNGMSKYFTKYIHKEDKSKLWVKITSRTPCLQKHSHPYNILSHCCALENFYPWQKSSHLWNRYGSNLLCCTQESSGRG